MSGHSKWSTIKHKKAAKDARRGKTFAKLIRQIEVAAREAQTSDETASPSLALAIQSSETEDAEISIEADPRGLIADHLAAARRSGFNRISFGVQDFDPVVQAGINRIQPEEMVASATRRAAS